MAVTSTYSLVTTKTEFQANSFEPGDQLLPDVTGLSNGGFAVAYNNSDGFVLVDFYDAAHNPVGTFKIPFDATTKAMGQPQLIELDNGNVLVTWENDVPGDTGVKGHLYTTAGEPIGSEIDLYHGAVDGDVQVAALEFGGFVVTDTSSGNVYQTRYTNEGVKIGFSNQVNGLEGDQADGAVAALSTGGYVVTYTDTDLADQTTIRARIYNADGSTHVNDFNIATGADNTQSKVVGLADGKWAVVYTDTGWDGADSGNSGIALQIFNGGANITPGSFIRVNNPSLQPDIEPDITVLENGFIVVSWTRHYTVTDSDIIARVYTAEGVAVMGEFSITVSNDMDVKSVVAGLLSGQFVTAWQDNTTDGSGGQITAEVTEIVRTTTGDGANDSFAGDALRDIVHGLGGQDDLGGGGSNDDLYGGSEDDSLSGSDGDDLLNGGTGIDNMYGGAGNDKFIVDNAADFAVESIGEGNADRVYASVSYQLVAGAEIEILNTSSNGGIGAINLVGNNFAQTIIGNAGNNIINGLGGIDTMNGLGGNDKYYVDNAADVIVEAAGGGTDRVYASANYSLKSGVEVEILSTNDANATTALKLAGNAFANAIVGNSGDNFINGAGGADTLTGWVGDDIFMFNTALAGGNIDAITDFSVADDTIRLDNAIFASIAGTGVLTAAQFVANATGTAQDANDRIIYETDTGELIYDANGSTAGGGFLFATLDTGLAITNADFFIV